MGLVEWLRDHGLLTGWIFAASVAVSVGTILLMPLLVARMRPDYFVSRRPGPDSWAGRHPVVRFVGLALKNLFGVLVVLAGIAMLVLPGQGVLAILLGISLLNFPGKRRIELWIVRRLRVLPAINWLRARVRRPPLIVPGPEDD